MLLVRNHLRGWSTNYREIVGKPDFFFKQENVAIFIDGCFWHGCPQCGHIPKTRSDFWKAKITRNKERDMKVTSENEQKGVKVLRFWEHELKNKISSVWPQLGEHCRKLLWMLYRGYSREEISKAFPQYHFKVVNTKIFRCRNYLRRLLRKEGYGI